MFCEELQRRRHNRPTIPLDANAASVHPPLPGIDLPGIFHVRTVPDARAIVEWVERGNLFWNAFRQLGEDCQKVLELFFQKIPMETIATQMGYGSEGYAKRRKLQCKDRLTELIKQDPAYPELL